MTEASRRTAHVPRALHFVLAFAAGAIVLLYLVDRDAYVALMQEDGLIEWATFILFLGAALVGGVRAVRNRRAFDFLVALFCLFVAGEEISWGQRLLGYMPPDFFLENNFQQETNIHNFSDLFGRPKWVLAALLGLYGVALPLAAAGAVRRLMERVGATPPPRASIPWFAACVLALAWYPVEYAGEWIEMLAGALFMAALAQPHALVAVAFALPVAGGLAWGSAKRGPSSAEQLACAAAETEALARDIVLRAGDRAELSEYGSVEKRIWSAAGAGYVRWELLGDFRLVACEGEDLSRVTARRLYGVDPWGSAYWLETEGGEDGSVAVYSFGPNRRRDLAGGDDIRAVRKWEAHRSGDGLDVASPESR